MKFDYTYITLFGAQVFEPMVLLTNLVFFSFSWYFFSRLRKFDNDYARHMSLFIFMLGISSIFGAIGHGVHYQLGVFFFSVVLFLMNMFSLLAIYYCFLAPFIYVRGIDSNSKKYLNGVRVWILALIALSIISGDFLIIKINAGVSLLYSLIMHLQAHKTRSESGNGLVVLGIAISFVPILVHTMQISLHEWFNHKDLSHVIMIIALIVIASGAFKTAEDLEEQIIPQPV